MVGAARQQAPILSVPSFRSDELILEDFGITCLVRENYRDTSVR
jgi:hypothetical protein